MTLLTEHCTGTEFGDADIIKLAQSETDTKQAMSELVKRRIAAKAARRAKKSSTAGGGGGGSSELRDAQSSLKREASKRKRAVDAPADLKRPTSSIRLSGSMKAAIAAAADSVEAQKSSNSTYGSLFASRKKDGEAHGGENKSLFIQTATSTYNMQR